MAKKPFAGEAAKKQPAKKNAAAAKAGAKKPPEKVAVKAAGRPPARAPEKPPAKAAKAKPAPKPRKSRAPAQAELPIAELEIIEDADIVAESSVESALEAALATLDDHEPEDDGDDGDGDDEVAETAGELAERAALEAEEVIAVDDQAPPLTPEEAELMSQYGEELAAPAVVHAEYSDRKTADEDRPMMPEINARDERKMAWQERRDRRRMRRDERDRQRHERREHRPHDGNPQGSRPDISLRPNGDQRGAGPGQGGDHRAQPPRPPAASSPAITLPPAGANGQEHDALGRVGTPLGDAAASVFAQLRNGQPLPVRQLAQMMRKRNLVEVDPEQLWPQLKAELLGDERSYRTLGLRPRIVYRGRDLFAPGPVAMSQTADAEANIAAALSRLAGATHRALAQRIAKATGNGFERLIHAYLVAAGYREIAWIKRVGGIAYAQVVAPGIDRQVLISARSGDQPIDRRGIGELRVGVEAKNLVAGILFSARELSEDAERELERAGRSIAVVCGDQLVATLIAAGVGVVSAAAPLHYVDDQLLDELLAG